MRRDILGSQQELLCHQSLQLLSVHHLPLSNPGTGGIVADVEKDITIVQRLLLHPKGKEPAGNRPHGIDAAALLVEDAGGILFAFQYRQVEDHPSALVLDFHIAFTVIVKSIHKVRGPHASPIADGMDILLSEINQVGASPKILYLLCRDEIIKLQRPFMVAA